MHIEPVRVFAEPKPVAVAVTFGLVAGCMVSAVGWLLAEPWALVGVVLALPSSAYITVRLLRGGRPVAEVDSRI
jgi:hypothetical protein